MVFYFKYRCLSDICAEKTGYIVVFLSKSILILGKFDVFPGNSCRKNGICIRLCELCTGKACRKNGKMIIKFGISFFFAEKMGNTHAFVMILSGNSCRKNGK